MSFQSRRASLVHCLAGNYFWIENPPEKVEPSNLFRFLSALPKGISESITYLPPEEARRRLTILYRLLYRLQKAHDLLSVRSDPDVEKLYRRADAVRRDAHKMKAFVRFRKVVDADCPERYIAWHQSQHRVLKRTAPFFVRRFASMNWSMPSRDVRHIAAEISVILPLIPIESTRS